MTWPPRGSSNGRVEGTHDKSSRKDRKDGAPEVTAERSPTRCPYCHDSCGPDDPRATVCQQCLSRHHAGCWREGDAQCASCGSKKALAPSTPAIALAPAERELLRRGLPREAIERVTRRLQVSEVEAQAALLELACQDLVKARAGSDRSQNAVALAAVIGFFIWMIVLAS